MHSLAPASTVFLGCLAYWLVTGELVFPGRSPMDTMLQHTQSEPVPPSQRTELHIPEALDRAILACLEKSPGDRPATAEDFGARLMAIATTRSWTPELSQQWWDAYHPKTALTG